MAQLIKIGIPKSEWNSDRTHPWYSDIRVEKKRVRRALAIYKPDAERKLRDMLNLRKAQRHGEIVEDMSWDYFKESILDESLTQFDKSTYYADRRAFELIDASTNLQYLKQMTPERLARLKVEWAKSGKYSLSTIARSLQSILKAMRWAEEMKYVAPQSWVSRRKRGSRAMKPKARTDYWTRDAYLELLKGLSGDMFTAALVMGRAGLRLGEMLHLEWEDIKFDSWQIVFRSKPHIVSAENPHGWRIKRDEELNEVRSIPMLILPPGPDLWQHLDAIRKPSGFVLGPNVSRLEHGFSRQLSGALKDTKVRTHEGKLGFPHLLRHTFGSHLAQIGVPLTNIRDWMGHKSLRMTEIYSHLSPSDTLTNINMVKKLWSAFVPGLPSTSPATLRLTALNGDLGNASGPSQIHENV